MTKYNWRTEADKI